MEQGQLILTVTTRKQKEEELNRLRSIERPAMTEQIKRAREYGDLAENFEYHAARQSQAILNGKIAEIEALLDRATIVDDPVGGSDEIGIGSVVTVRDMETEDEWDYVIVDATSSDPANDRISYSSPVGKALMKHKVGDVVEVLIPAGLAKYEIVAMRYE